MKNTRFFIGISMALTFALAGCSGGEVEPQIVIDIEKSPDLVLTKVGNVLKNQFTVNILPDARTVKYKYAIGSFDDKQAFENGTMTGIVEVDNSDEDQLVFDELTPATTYTVYARGYDADNKAGPVALLSVLTNAEDGFTAGMQYVTNSSAGFTVTTSQDCYKFEYALGKSEDRAAFENGTLAGIGTREESYEYTLNFFDLEPDTDYVFFSRGYDRTGEPFDIYETPVKTFADDALPDIDFTKTSDAYYGEYIYTPNDECGKIITYISRAGTYNEAIDMINNGNLMSMLPNWLAAGQNLAAVNVDGQPLGLYFLTRERMSDVELESYVLVFDKEDNPVGVKKFSWINHPYDNTLAKPQVSANITNITTTGATYEFSADANTLGFFFDTVDADWYDEFKLTAGFNPNYIRDLFLNRELYWRYNDKAQVDPWTETTAVPGKRYYLAVCPMNGNGVSDPNWGELSLIEYTTANY